MRLGHQHNPNRGSRIVDGARALRITQTPPHPTVPTPWVVSARSRVAVRNPIAPAAPAARAPPPPARRHQAAVRPVRWPALDGFRSRQRSSNCTAHTARQCQSAALSHATDADWGCGSELIDTHEMASRGSCGGLQRSRATTCIAPPPRNAVTDPASPGPSVTDESGSRLSSTYM